jgi:tetratricopeptide (TPR) repeat protein
MKHALVAGATLLLLALGAREGQAQGAMVRGKVVDEQGQPLAGVTVELKSLGKEPKTFKRTTNDKGSFVQVGLPSGRFRIQYSKAGYATALQEVNLDAGEVNEVPAVTLKAAAAAQAAAPQEAVRESQTKEVVEAFAKAQEALRAGQVDEAEAQYRAVLAKAPDVAEAHFNLGVLHQRKRDYAAAEADFKRVIELQPDKSDTYSALAAVYDATDRHDEAYALLSSAASRFDADARFQFNLGVTCLNANRGEMASAAFRKALELDPLRVEAHFHLATLALSGGNVPEAIQRLETYVSLSGQTPQNLATAKKLLESLKKPAGR